MEGVKERVIAFKTSFADRLYLDKILKKKSAGANGIGDLQYFTYPDSMNGSLAALDDIEDQIAQSGLEFSGQGTGEYEIGIIDLEERLI
jgi:hypothetical protein